MMIIIRVFIFSGIVFGACLGLVFSIYSGEVLRAFKAGLLGGISFAVIMSAYLSCMLILFKKRLFFYGNVEEQLRVVGMSHVVFEGIAGNATTGRIKYGSLFLNDDFVVFVPQRFAVKPSLIKLPLDTIVGVKKAGINLMKFFSGGLRKRLLLETKDDVKYEFSVWELDSWIKEITARIKR